MKAFSSERRDLFNAPGLLLLKSAMGSHVLRNISVLALGSVFLGACAQMQPSQTATPQQNAFVGATCAKVMRLDPGEAEYEGCVSDLSDVVVAQLQYAREIRAYRTCGESGLKRHTAEFSRCVLKQEDDQQAARPNGSGTALQFNVADVKSADDNPRDYYTANFDLRRRREEYACAQTGLEPGSEAFATCANNLDVDLFNIAHPQG
ncbi:MAG: hypothetical protein J0G99_03505 [Alphaproteobacteria bacterium]|nr:hypothetical protein [Alphaproteobacteria bacterium]